LLIFFSFKEFLLGLILCCWNLKVLSAKVVNLQNLHENSGCWCGVCVLICAKDWILSQLCGFQLYPMVFVGWVSRRHDYFDLQVQEEKVGDSKLISQTSYSPLAISELSSKEIWDCCPFSHLSHESPLVPFFHCLYLNFLTDWSETCFLLLVLEE
jgi:hypothetical protein